jgi:hypothetical protein
LHNFAWFLLELVSTELVGCSKTKKQKISLQLFEEKNQKKTQDYNNNFLWGVNGRDKN